MTRTPMKNILLTALHWLICCTISAGAVLIQFLLSKPTGETASSFIFTSDIYRVNPLMWTLGAILGVAGIAAVMRCLLRYDLCCCLTHKKRLAGTLDISWTFRHRADGCSRRHGSDSANRAVQPHFIRRRRALGVSYSLGVSVLCAGDVCVPLYQNKNKQNISD